MAASASGPKRSASREGRFDHHVLDLHINARMGPSDRAWDQQRDGKKKCGKATARLVHRRDCFAALHWRQAPCEPTALATGRQLLKRPEPRAYWPRGPELQSRVEKLSGQARIAIPPSWGARIHLRYDITIRKAIAAALWFNTARARREPC